MLKTTARNILESLFGNLEVITPEEAYKKFTRPQGQGDIEKNKKWLRNKTTPLKRMSLIQAVYSKQNGSLERILLTKEGKSLLELSGTDKSKEESEDDRDNSVLVRELLRAVSDFNKSNLDLEATITIGAKKS